MTVLDRTQSPNLLTLTPQQTLAILARALYREGYDDHHVGHLSIRQDDGSILVSPWPLAWDEARASDVVRIDIDGNLLEGRWDAPPAIALHLALYRMRPDVRVGIHQHPHWATVWAATGRIPPAYDQASAFIADDDMMFFTEYTGPVDEATSASRNIAGLGDASCVFLANHGVLVVGDTVEWAHHLSVWLEWRCRLAWRVEALTGGRPIDPVQAANLASMHRAYGGLPRLFEAAVRREVAADPSVLD